MKKLKLFAAMTVMCTGLQAQPLTGINTYLYSQPLELTDGTNTSICPGFILAGVLPSGSGPSIYINKTDGDGMLFGLSCGEFANEYKFAADMVKPCGGNMTTATKCYGVSLTELTYNPGTAERYAITAAFERGCLFSVLDMSGNVMPAYNAYYTFPVGAIKQTKPVIAQSVFAPGWLYFTGSYEVNSVPHMYVIEVDINGGSTFLNWTRDYTVSSGAKELIPSDIIESPYSPSGTKDVVVVGTVYEVSGLNREGFFFPIDITNGAGGSMLIYGSGGSTDEKFLAINIANSGGSGLPGYIIGGYTDSNMNLASSWMLKLDPDGTVIQWSSIMPPSYGTRGAVTGVLERFSNVYGKYEYYGTATENKAMTVFKLDEFGNMFGGNNEFLYNDNIGGWGTPVAITDNNVAGDANEGIHVFGTNVNTPGDYFLARACFNGAAGKIGCTTANITINTINNYQGPGKISKRPIKINKGPAPCKNFGFGGGPTGINVIAPCNENVLPTTPYVGDNSKSAGATGIQANSASDKFSVSPNPVSDKLTISYSSNSGANVSIGLYNNLGQLVTPAVTPKALQGENTMELDLNTLNINSGIYFVTVTSDGVSTTKKIIYTR
jgi:type IX secretion system substrate protein